MIEALRITVIGMGLVFAAMALVLGAMLLLTLIRGREKDAAPQAASEPAPTDERAGKLRVAVMAAAIARARWQTHSTPIAPPSTASNAASPWMAYHRSRQLNKDKS